MITVVIIVPLMPVRGSHREVVEEWQGNSCFLVNVNLILFISGIKRVLLS